MIAVWQRARTMPHIYCRVEKSVPGQVGRHVPKSSSRPCDGANWIQDYRERGRCTGQGRLRGSVPLRNGTRKQGPLCHCVCLGRDVVQHPLHCPMQQTVNNGTCMHGPGLDNVACVMETGGGTPRGLKDNGELHPPLWQVALAACAGSAECAGSAGPMVLAPHIAPTPHRTWPGSWTCRTGRLARSRSLWMPAEGWE